MARLFLVRACLMGAALASACTPPPDPTPAAGGSTGGDNKAVVFQTVPDALLWLWRGYPIGP